MPRRSPARPWTGWKWTKARSAYSAEMDADTQAWNPAVPGVVEVYHRRQLTHVYPMHTHDTWTLLIIDSGIVRYDLGRHEHGALRGTVSLLPPHVAHNGAPATEQGLRKRVLYLERERIGAELIGPAVDHPEMEDALLRRRIHQLHGALLQAGEELEAESRLALVCERLRGHLSGALDPAPTVKDPGLAARLQELIDARVVQGVTLSEAAALLHAHPTHLARAFTRRFGLAPHQYLIGRRVDLARRLLLEGMAPAEAAVAAGFCDQPHLTRHFTRVLGIAPGRYVRSRPPRLNRAAAHL
jgi:AraC-like DNA-binding protein